MCFAAFSSTSKLLGQNLNAEDDDHSGCLRQSLWARLPSIQSFDTVRITIVLGFLAQADYFMISIWDKFASSYLNTDQTRGSRAYTYIHVYAIAWSLTTGFEEALDSLLVKCDVNVGNKGSSVCSVMLCKTDWSKFRFAWQLRWKHSELHLPKFCPSACKSLHDVHSCPCLSHYAVHAMFSRPQSFRLPSLPLSIIVTWMCSLVRVPKAIWGKLWRGTNLTLILMKWRSLQIVYTWRCLQATRRIEVLLALLYIHTSTVIYQTRCIFALESCRLTWAVMLLTICTAQSFSNSMYATLSSKAVDLDLQMQQSLTAPHIWKNPRRSPSVICTLFESNIVCL